MKKHLLKKRYLLLSFLLAAGIVFYFSLPQDLFPQPNSYVLLDKDGRLLQAHIAADGQWRFPSSGQVPEKFKLALLTYEDKRFAYHPGIDPLALGRALLQYVRNGKVTSGASTITMQVARLSKQNPRTVWHKITEMWLALRLEAAYSKEDVLQLYASHAPFGGNVVGLEAAAWRYFGRSAHELSWGEAASLAVLPNSPSMVRPDRNRAVLKAKRDYLLNLLFEQKHIDSTTLLLAKLEPIPDKPLPLPEFAPHLLTSIVNHHVRTADSSTLVLSSIDVHLQKQVDVILKQHHSTLASNGINNAAALVLDVETGNVLAYVGNIYQPGKPEAESYVDVIQAPRSPGSTLKPLLYEAAMHDGLITPQALLADIPTQVAGYSPKNFDLQYDGAVPANRALARSLNVPAVRLLQQYRVERFYQLMKQMGISTLNFPSDHYGLSLILGGGENSLWELTGMYASMARVLNHYSKYNSRYNPADIHPPMLHSVADENKAIAWTKLPTQSTLSAGSLYATFEAMQEVMRPGEEQLWTQFNSAQRIAWKTGTSFGFRDGWAIGITRRYAVGVWTGNADGEGRPGLIGVATAAPILFDIFRYLPASRWFDKPYDDLRYIRMCRQSGCRASTFCDAEDSILVPASVQRTGPCPYHQVVHLDASGKYRVHSECESVQNMQHVNWFVLPPAMEWYYKNHNPWYRTLPPWRADCNASAQGEKVMEIIFPRRANSIYIPVELDGKTGRCVFEVAHRQKQVRIFWHLDGTYMGETTELHQMELAPEPGKHELVLIDANGNRFEQGFEVLENKKGK